MFVSMAPTNIQMAAMDYIYFLYVCKNQIQLKILWLPIDQQIETQFLIKNSLFHQLLIGMFYMHGAYLSRVEAHDKFIYYLGIH